MMRDRGNTENHGKGTKKNGRDCMELNSWTQNHLTNESEYMQFHRNMPVKEAYPVISKPNLGPEIEIEVETVTFESAMISIINSDPVNLLSLTPLICYRCFSPLSCSVLTHGTKTSSSSDQTKQK